LDSWQHGNRQFATTWTKTARVSVAVRLPIVEAKIPSVCVTALVGVASHFGYGPFTVFPQSHHNEPFMPGDRTCSGGAYTFQIPGSLAAQDNVGIPLKVQNAASIRCVYAYLQQGTSDGQSA
jgi:hypothetical protein